MALTATATNTTLAAIVKILDMQKPIIVSIYPGKDNIMYYIAEKSSVKILFVTICDKLSCERAKMGRLIIIILSYIPMMKLQLYITILSNDLE